MPYTFDHDTFDGRRPDAERDPLIGTSLDDRYWIEDRIATGGFGAIYRARTASGEVVALKILHPRLVGDPTMVARFRREGATLTRLHDPHTVTTLAVGETRDGMLYIAMELLAGESLGDHLHRAGALPWQTAVAIARAVCSSLAEAHALGVVHRDLKPANIHVESRGGSLRAVKVIDFGIVKIARGSSVDDGNDLTCAGHMIGTNDYMSPEQLLGAPCSGASDLYSLGVVTYEMLTGRLPHPRVASPEAMITAIVTQTPVRPSVLAAIPPELDRIVMRCLERDQAARYGSVVELARDLDRLLALRVAPHDEITIAHPAWQTVRDDRPWADPATDGLPDEPSWGAGAHDPSPLSPWTLPMTGAFRGPDTPPAMAIGTGKVPPRPHQAGDPGGAPVGGFGDEPDEAAPRDERAAAPRARGSRPKHGTLPGVAVAPERLWPDPAHAADATVPAPAHAADGRPHEPALTFPPQFRPWLVPPLVPPDRWLTEARTMMPAPAPPQNARLWWIAVAILAITAAASLAILLQA